MPLEEKLQPGPPAYGSCLYRGHVMHRRLHPFGNHFVYRVFSLLVDIDALPVLDHRLRLFSHDRFNLFSVWNHDHGSKDQTALRPWIDRQLADAGINLQGGRVMLLCFPRILGFVFNPLSVWYCYDRSGHLAAMLYEVRNTFGDCHCYLIPTPPDFRPERTLLQYCNKVLHVSPFLSTEGTYAFRLQVPGDRLSIAIRHTTAEGETLVAVQKGRRHALTDTALFKAFFSYPLMTVKVIAAIHWEAFKLWRLGARFYRRPDAPQSEVSVVRPPLDQAAE
ncbi:DUF1365 domain-containing protein [Limibacillus sp. MBR-115]|uniref:DUF1365 domain-containing protein n=1 Tax=Limibacillus sp. MBR-115 TaxID=3156465 RepID=UPI00339495B3